MKKKILFIITFLAIFVICSVGLFACNGGKDGKDGLSAYELYKKYHTEYNKTEEEFLDDLVNNRLGEDENPQGLDFCLLPNGTYAVEAGQSKYLEKIIIPETYKGKPVTEIVEFNGSNNLKELVIPNSVTTIGGSAFSGCPIENATIPTTAISSIPKGSLKTVIITGGDSIGRHAFAYCSSLTNVTIGDSVTAIGDYAFSYCSSLTSVTIGNSVTTIGSYAFSYCSSLTSVTIGNRVTTIGEEAFSNCYSLTSIEIPNSVTTIGNYAFYKCSSLTSVTIGNSVTTIGGSAFRYCSSLESVTIGDSVTTIGEEAFSNCYSLTRINVDENNNNYKSIDDNLYSKNGKTLIQYAIGKKDTTFEIPDSVTTIGNYAFYWCSSLESVTIGDSVTTIGDWAFVDCSSLTSVTIPDSVTTIGNGAFAGCSSLTSVTIPDSVTTIGYGAFRSCSSLTSIEIPNSVTTIGSYAFFYCSSLTSVTIGNSVTTIGNGAFEYCSSLQSITFNDSSNWYRTTSSTNWQNKTGGILTDLSNPSQNATYFTSTYCDYYWYKK